jgi:hypothetical protein
MRQAARFHLLLAACCDHGPLHDQIVRSVACGMDVGVIIGVLIRKRGVGHVCARNGCHVVLSGTVPMRGRGRNRVYIRLVNGIRMGNSDVFLEME